MSLPASATAVRLPALVLGVLVGFCALVLLTPLGSDTFDADLSNVVELYLATLASATALWRSRRCVDRRRRAWAAVSLGCGGWAAGQAVWCWYEVVQREAAPFPSVADVGFLVLPVAMSAGLWLYGSQGGWRNGRRMLDALTVTTSLALVSWSTVLGAVVEAGAENRLAFAVAIAYPVGDLVLLVLTVLLLAGDRGDRLVLALLGCGLVAFAVADSGFAYASATGAFSSGGPIDLGWTVGFALMALAPLAATQDGRTGPQAAVAVRVAAPRGLPYVAVLVAVVVVVTRTSDGEALQTAEKLLVGASFALVLARQFATLRENSSLVADLASREAELRHQAFHDGLTGLANRALFYDRLTHALELHRSDLRPLAVLLCDLDDFKVVNDTLGHAAGDDLLVRVAERLRGALRSADTLARLGGDEFAVLLEGGEGVDGAEATSLRVVDALSAPFVVDGSSLTVSTSVGLAVVATSAITPERGALLGQADTAMYAAKRAGKRRARVYEPGMSLAEVEERRMAEALRLAVRERRIGLVYQPVVDVATGAVEGVEALARWSWDGRDVPPTEFIAVAERTGLVAELTDLVLDIACAQLAAWDARLHLPGLRMGVNVAPQDLVGGDLPLRVAAALRRYDVDPDRLVLEITETGLVTDLDAGRAATAALRRLGVRLALDDFGVGYSSLAHLHTIPLQILKIDRQFLAGLGREEGQERFLRALLALGRDLGLHVVAEGVERPEQLALLQTLGCEMAQGYLLARPLPAEQVERLLLDGVPVPAGR